jgi:hypothetical protein
VQQEFDVSSNSCHIHSYVCQRTHTHTHIQHFHSSTVLCIHPRERRTLTEAMKARQKCRLAGPTTGCWTNQLSCIEEKQRVRQTAVRYTQKRKQTHTHTHTHTHTVTHTHTHTHFRARMYDCLRSESKSGERIRRANQRHTRHHRSSRVCQ